jgi:molybdopterin converting factor small subunit
MKKLVLGLLILVLLGGAVACAASEAPVMTTTTTAYPAPSPESHTYGLDKSSATSPQPVVVPALPPAITLAPPPEAPDYTTSDGGSAYSEVQAAPADRMVIRSAYMALVVEDVSDSLAKITDLADAFGGYVVNSDIREDQNRLYASVSFRVDANRFNEALQALRDLAVDVRSESTSGQDVTEEYIDLDARLRNLQASEAQLLELMQQAGDVSEILDVQRELTDTRGQIEQIKGRLQYLEQSSNLALFNVSLEQSTLALEFTATVRTVKEGDKVQFVPTISGGFAPYSYEWDFGDGGTSTEGAPAHAYRREGTYTVALKIKDDKGNNAESERKDYITVLSGWDSGNVASGAWNGLVAFGHVVVNIIIWLGIFSPVWIIILVILYFAWWRRRKKS